MLREHLNAACDHVTPERNMELVQAISTEFPHTIVPLSSEFDLALYTCLVYALGFTENPGYTAIATLPGRDIYAGKDFAEWLLSSGSLIEIDIVQAPPESLVFYFDDVGTFTHVGLLNQDGRVRSKWGCLGLYEHNLLDVPLNYSNTTRQFQPLSFQTAIELFYDYAEEMGVEFE
jgi:hypothetical protein